MSENRNREYTAAELRGIISGKKRAGRVPDIVHFWAYPPSFERNESAARKVLAAYPCDAKRLDIMMPQAVIAPPDDPNFVWLKNSSGKLGTSYDNSVYISDEDFGNGMERIAAGFDGIAGYKGIFGAAGKLGFEDAKGPDAYRLGALWYMFFERHWSLRGMQNAMTDFYDYPESVSGFYAALADLYCKIILRAKNELGIHGMLISDDIGAQAAPMFNEEIFKKFFKPNYKKVIDFCHSIGIEFWLHSCGNVEPFIPHFIELKLDVLHPIQKYTMDQRAIAKKYGDKICIWAGFDVQRVLPFGTSDDVRNEVREMREIYKGSRWMFTLGNGATPDIPIDNLEALLDEVTKN